MFRIYLDNILQDVEDIININDLAEFTIIREDGFNSSEQILREKTEMELHFTGETYKYICDTMANNRCAEIEFLFEDEECGLQWQGIINTTMVELQIGKKTGKTKIKDTSFSAYIRDFLNIEINLYSSRTKGCEVLVSVNQNFLLRNAPGNTTSIKTVQGFDVLDVFKFLVNYFTDNTVNVVSNYLTSNKYMITTGYNMHNHAGSYEDAYPDISINTLFDELRKKLRIYMGIEYTISGVPYLRIEQEDYFFTNTVLYTLTDIPVDTVQTYDVERNFNQIEIGSETFRPADEGSEIYYPQKRYTAWNNEVYNSCGTCTANKNQNLEIVSQYITDSNVIYEALNWGATDYDYDGNIFLINYEVISGANYGIRDLVDGTAVYNLAINNESVLENWIDYYGKCLTLSAYPKNGFWIKHKDYEIFATPQYIGFDLKVQAEDRIQFPDDVFDLEASLTNVSQNITTSPNLNYGSLPGISVTVTYFEVPVNGNYNFRASVSNFRQLTNLGDDLLLDFMISIDTYSDDTMVTLLNSYSNTVYAQSALNDGINIEVTTGEIAMTTGETVIISISFRNTTVPSSLSNYEYSADIIDFQLLSDPESCNTVDNNDQNSKPFLLEFNYPLCYEDFAVMRDNKSGYIQVGANKYWISELKYKPKKLTTFKLMGNNSICGC